LKIISDKYAYLLFSLNIVTGATILFIIPTGISETEYTKVLIHLFGLQFASLFEAGAVLFFINLVTGKAISQNDAFCAIRTVSGFQIVLAVASSLIYSAVNLGTGEIVAATLMVLHTVFSLAIVPRLLATSMTDGYERVQMYKAMQAAVALSLILLQQIFHPSQYILLLAFPIGSLITLIIVAHSEENPKIRSRISLFEGASYVVKIVSSSIGWLFVNFMMGSFLSAASSPTVGQNWLLFRTADSLLAARFANRIASYSQRYRNRKYITASALSLYHEAPTILLVLAPTILISTIITDETWPAALATWMILNRINSTINIFILPDYLWKNLVNMAILIFSGVMAIYLDVISDPFTILLTMWTFLVSSNLFYKRR